MKRLFILIFLLASCTPVTNSTSPTQVVTVYSTSAAMPWLTELYSCAEDMNVAIDMTANSPEISLRLGEPEAIISPTYQVGEDELIIISHRDNQLQNLTLEEVQTLFTESGNTSMQVWVYSSDADIQILFEQVVMKGRSVSSFAKVAVSSQKMSEAVGSDSNAVGILPRSSMNSGQNIREVYSAGKVPVLATTKVEATGVVRELLVCLSK